jgi:hypothetical protein
LGLRASCSLAREKGQRRSYLLRFLAPRKILFKDN